jgi:replicative DNA helicase
MVVNLPVGEKGDVTDYINAGNSRADLDALISFSVEDKPVKKARVENKKLREPAATQSEKLILGAILNGTSVFEDIEELSANDFYHDDHKIVFNAIKTLWEEIGVGDVKAVAQYLDDKTMLEQIGGITALLDLSSDMPSVYSLEAHIDAIRSKAGSRILLDNLEHAANQLVMGENCEKVQQDIINNAGRLKVGNSINLTSSSIDLITDIDELLKPKPQGITCDPVQPVFDSFFGLHPGVLITIGARSGHGKTSLMNQIIAYGCVKYKNATDLLTFEIPKQDALVKIIAQTARVPYLDILRGNITEEQNAAIRKMASVFGKANFRIDDKNSWSIPKLRSYLKTRRSAGDPLRMLCIDYLQIANFSGSANSERRDLAIGKVTSGLKGLAIEFGLTIVLLSQLNRAMDRDGSSAPAIGNLRDSSGQENDSDIVLLLSQKMDEAPEDDYRASSIIIAKNRNGSVGSFNARFHMPTASFIC